MATVTGFTAERMLAIEAGTVVDGEVGVDGHLYLERHDGTVIDAGGVQAPYAIGVVDTPGIDLQLTGAGTPGTPWSLKALLSSAEMTLPNLNSYVTQGIWTASTVALANTLINWPVEGIPRADLADANNAAGSWRGAPTGTLRVMPHSSGRIEQEVTIFGSTGAADIPGMPNGTMPFTYKRSRSVDGVTWGSWILQNPTFAISSQTERDFVSKQYLIGSSSRSPAKCYYANGGGQNALSGWYTPFEQFSTDGVQWWHPGASIRQGSSGWTDLTLLNGFVGYSSSGGWAPVSAIRTSAGIITLKGLAVRGSIPAAGTVIAVLPPGMRPCAKMAFGGPSTSGSSAAQVVVLTNGEIQFVGTPTGALTHLDLECIIFPAADVAPLSAWTPVTLGSGWVQWTADTAYGVPSYWQDKYGRVWFRGMVQGSPSGVADSRMFSVPLALAPVLQVHCAAIASPANGAISSHFVGTAGVGVEFIYKSSNPAMSNGWVSLSQYFLFPVANIPEQNWRTVLLANGWIRYPTNTFPIPAIWTAPDGITHIRGLISAGTVGASASLPMGTNDRPIYNKMVLANSNNGMNRYSVNGGIGDYTIVVNSGSNVWFSLDGGHYMTET